MKQIWMHVGAFAVNNIRRKHTFNPVSLQWLLCNVKKWLRRSHRGNQSKFSPLHPYTHRTQSLVWLPWCDSRGLGALVWQPQPSFSISDRSCLMAEKSRKNASRIARQKKMKTGCEWHGERESERRREDRATKRGRTGKTIRCYQSEQ